MLEAMEVRSRGQASPTWSLRNAPWLYAIDREASRRSVGVLLLGNSGNLTVSYSGEWGLYDLRRRKNWRELRAAIKRQRESGHGWAGIVMRLLGPSPQVRRVVDAMRGRPSQTLFSKIAIRPQAFRESDLPSEVAGYDYRLQLLRTGAEGRLRALSAADPAMQMAMSRRLFGFRTRDSLGDRRVVELCLSIPDEAFCPGGIARQRMRRVVADVLPQRVLKERLRGLQGSDFHARFSKELPGIRREFGLIEKSPAAQYFLDLRRCESVSIRGLRTGLKATTCWK